MEVMALVRDVNETLATIKGNVKRTAEVLAGWVANPMFDRKEGKVCCCLVALLLFKSWFIINTYNLLHICCQRLSNQPCSLDKACCKPCFALLVACHI